MDNLDLLYSDLQIPEESVPVATPIQQQPQNIPVQQIYQQPQNQNMFPQNNFNPVMPKRDYTDAEWTLKEDWYVNETNGIKIPDAPNPADIQAAATRIDTLLSLARIDSAYINQKTETYSLQLKVQEKQLFVDLKINPPQQYKNALKLTVDEMKGVVTSYINNNKWGNTPYSLYTLVSRFTERSIFIDAIIKTLQDKKDLLITHSGMLKIENSLNSLQNNTPGAQQYPRY